MKDSIQNLLPKKVREGVALTFGFSKIKPKVPTRVKRLTKSSIKFTFVAFLLFFFSGYYPTWSFPPIKLSHALAVANDNQQSEEISAAAFPGPLVLPHPGYISTRFSSWHPGIDIATPLGTPIHPISAGVVDDIGFDIFGLGNYVEVDHGNGFRSKYAHLAKADVRRGEKVTSDNILGEVGLTGHTSGPHTHLEITYKGRYVDPQLLLPPLSDIPKPQYITQQSLPRQ